MRLKTFSANNLQAAMKLVRESLGDDAVILSTVKEAGGKNVTITAAFEVEETQQKTLTSNSSYMAHIMSRQQQTILRELEKILRFHGTPDYLTEKFMQTAQYIEPPATSQQENTQKYLIKLLDAIYTYAPLPDDGKSFRIMLVGPPGIGKTVTVAKIAAALTIKKKPVTVITTDNKRAGGIEQLESLTKILGVRLHVATSRAELKTLLDSHLKEARIIIDSAGCNPYSFDELKELAQFATVEGIEPVLVAAAGGDSTEAEEIARAFAFLGVRRLLITRTDSAKRLGSVLATATAGNLSFCNISTSMQVASGLEKMDAPRLCALLMKHRIDLKP